MEDIGDGEVLDGAVVRLRRIALVFVPVGAVVGVGRVVRGVGST